MSNIQSHKTEWQIALKVKKSRNPSQSIFQVSSSQNGDKIIMQNPVLFIKIIFV